MGGGVRWEGGRMRQMVSVMGEVGGGGLCGEHLSPEKSSVNPDLT